MYTSHIIQYHFIKPTSNGHIYNALANIYNIKISQTRKVEYVIINIL